MTNIPLCSLPWVTWQHTWLRKDLSNQLTSFFDMSEIPLWRRCGKISAITELKFPKSKNASIRLTSHHKNRTLKSSSTSHHLVTLSQTSVWCDLMKQWPLWTTEVSGTSQPDSWKKQVGNNTNYLTELLTLDTTQRTLLETSTPLTWLSKTYMGNYQFPHQLNKPIPLYYSCSY